MVLKREVVSQNAASISFGGTTIRPWSYDLQQRITSKLDLRSAVDCRPYWLLVALEFESRVLYFNMYKTFSESVSWQNSTV